MLEIGFQDSFYYTAAPMVVSSKKSTFKLLTTPVLCSSEMWFRHALSNSISSSDVELVHILILLTTIGVSGLDYFVIHLTIGFTMVNEHHRVS